MAPWSRKKSDATAKDTEKAVLESEKSLAAKKTNSSDLNGNRNRNSDSHDEALPAYSAEPPQEPTAADMAALTAVLANLSLPTEPKALSPQSLTFPRDDNASQYMWPTADECLAHLKFLFAVHALKEDIGYTDGVFGLYDALAAVPDDVVNIPLNLPDKQGPPATDDERYRARLAQVREKRWALYVARAADRYEAWWAAVTATNRRPEEGDMEVADNPQYSDFVSVQLPRDARVWNADNLLPLDVWMVMHAHMLNPRAFLEDCIRYGARDIWAAGMPWAPVSAAIDNEQFTYTNVSNTAKAKWTALTGRAWDNVDDPATKNVQCPLCFKETSVPWTTCGGGGGGGDNSAADLLGTGYGDGGDGFEMTCGNCGFVVDRKTLAVGKFVFNCLELIRGDKPMPGTILDPKTGRPEAIPPRLSIYQRPEPRTFPNRMIKRGGMMAAIVGGTGNGVALEASATPPQPALIDRSSAPRTTSMETVKARIEDILSDSNLLKDIDEYRATRFRYRPQEMARLSIRKMMSRYWDNASAFALDLTGAVLRQGIFIDKMHQLDWLHSPAARATMERVVVKYQRFLGLIADHPQQMCVPTLDVDLGWHTHQLQPPAYYHTSIRRTGVMSVRHGGAVSSVTGGKFIDHDDKLDEDKLHLAFEYTSKIYQETYGEVYSECTCWYCEAVRAASYSSVGARLGLSRQGDVVNNFHKSGAADRCPAPDRAAHVSAHNAVLFVDNDVRSKVTRQLRAAQLGRLNNNYAKAVRRAERNGRKLPPRDQYYDHWGYQYYSK